ncbi:class I tRNA ligase family protein [Escherichia coli]
MGHAFQQTLMDTLIRDNRMQARTPCGRRVPTTPVSPPRWWLSARLPQKKGNTRLRPGSFIDKIWQWKEESGGTITRQMRRLGDSVDWERERFTMDEGLPPPCRKCSSSTKMAGRPWQASVNCIPVNTAISHLGSGKPRDQRPHVAPASPAGQRRQQTAEGQDYLIVATTRPETMLGDTAVAVNPEDPRYKALIGQHITCCRW